VGPFGRDAVAGFGIGVGLATGCGAGAIITECWAGATLAAAAWAGAGGREVASITGGAGGVGRATTTGGDDAFAASGSGGGGGIEGLVDPVDVCAGAGSAAALSGLPDASHITPPMTATAAPAAPRRSPVFDLPAPVENEGDVGKAGRGGLAVIRCVDGVGIGSGAACRVEPP
jgi:hypothetical protein